MTRIVATHCQHCGALAVRDPEHDAYYCAACKLWLESACADPDCVYCRARPEAPPPFPWSGYGDGDA